MLAGGLAVPRAAPAGTSGFGSGSGGSTPTHTVGGTVSGLSGTVVLQDNGGDNLSVW